MTRASLGYAILAGAVVVAVACGTLVAWRLINQTGVDPNTPPTMPTPIAIAVEPAPLWSGGGRPSTVIDLPGDPVVVRGAAAAAPREFSVSLPTRIDPRAARTTGAAYFVDSTLLASDGGPMLKFSEAGREAESLANQLDSNVAAIAGTADLAATEMDDDGGAATPDNLQDLLLTPANSNRIDIRPAEAPAIKTVVARTFASDRIGSVLIANGFGAESASRIEASAKELFNFQSLPPNGGIVAVGALGATGDYRVAQLVIYQGDDYVGTVALGDGGAYFEGARPAAAPGLLDDNGKPSALNTRYTLADGLYSAGLRAAMPESVVRAAIELVGPFVDLKAPLTPDETFRALFAKDPRGKGKDPGKVIYVSLAGPVAAYDCYVYEDDSDAFACFDPRGSTAPGAEPPRPPSAKEHAQPAEREPSPTPSPNGHLGAQIVDLPAPVRGARISSLFGMRFHPILQYWRLHAGIDFAAPMRSPVRAVDDGVIETAEPVSGFGNHVKINHGGYATSYSHLSEIPPEIHSGVAVKRGDVIALSGNTGLSTGPHLHFEFYLDGAAVDPLPHMSAEAREGGPMEEPIRVAAAGGHVPTAAEIAEFRAFKAQIDAIVAEQTK